MHVGPFHAYHLHRQKVSAKSFWQGSVTAISGNAKDRKWDGGLGYQIPANMEWNNLHPPGATNKMSLSWGLHVPQMFLFAKDTSDFVLAALLII